jgi:type II secretory pathway pseudopilin PulG
MTSGKENPATKGAGAGLEAYTTKPGAGLEACTTKRGAQGTKGGFTLLELLVVVGIIILLIGILVPALSAARIAAQKAATESLFNGLQSSISQYATNLNGQLPGCFPQVGTPQTVGNSATITNKISGSQNLMLSLSYRLYVTPPDTAQALALPGGATYTVDVANPNGPLDRSMTPNKQYSAFYSPVLNDLKTSASGFTLSNATGAWSGFPVVVDKFSDPLPILFFRCDQTSGTWASNDKSSLASYYRQENSEYLDATQLQSITGSKFDEYNKSSYSSKAGTGAAATNLGTAISSAIGGSGATFANRGDYVLISAGADRIYGKSGTATTSDDLIRVGTK